MTSERITDISERATEFNDLETGKMKIIVLDGMKGKATVIEMPKHGNTLIETRRGLGHKVRFEDEFLL